MKKLIIILLICNIIGNANAATTGNNLFSNLQSNNSGDKLIAYAYIEGVVDTDGIFKIQDALSLKPPEKKFKFNYICFGDNQITFGQIKDIVYKYLDGHPEIRHQNGAVLIRNALLEHFYCAGNPNVD